MSRPLVSVVMVVCNVDRFLAEAIDSILNQTVRDLELVIVDYGSQDRSKSIVSERATKDKRVKFHEIAHCSYIEARNASCSLANSDYLAIMDADDVAVERRLEWQIDFLQKSPKVGVVGGGVEWIDARGAALGTGRNPCESSEIQVALSHSCPIWHPTVVMRREAFVAAGGYRSVCFPAEDYDLWLRISQHYALANLPQILLRYRVHPGQASIRKREQQTLAYLAAQVSERSRRRGLPDPLDPIKEITPELLQELGMDQATIQKLSASARLTWMRNLFMAAEYSSALEVYSEIMQSSDWTPAKKTIVDASLLGAQIYWKQGQLLRSLICAGGAFLRRPVIAGRPLKAALRSFQAKFRHA